MPIANEEQQKEITFQKGHYYVLVKETYFGDNPIDILLKGFVCTKKDILMELPEREENLFIDVSLAKKKFKFVEVTEKEARSYANTT